MKKNFLLVGGAILASMVMTGCAGIGTNNGAVTLSGSGMNIYSEMSANAMLPQYAAQDAVVVKRDVTATAELKSIFTIPIQQGFTHIRQRLQKQLQVLQMSLVIIQK